MPSAFLGVPLPIRDTSVRSPLIIGVPTPDYVPSTAFLALSTGYSSTHRAGLFHPTATSGIHTSGVFPAAKPARLIAKSCPPAVAKFLLTASCPAAARSTQLASRALSEQRSVAEDRRFRPAVHSIPSRVFNSRGLFSGCLGDAFTPPPFMTFRAECSLYSRRRACNVSISNQPDDLSPDHLPVRALRPFIPATRGQLFRGRSDLPSGPLRPPNGRGTLQAVCQAPLSTSQ